MESVSGSVLFSFYSRTSMEFALPNEKFRGYKFEYWRIPELPPHRREKSRHLSPNNNDNNSNLWLSSPVLTNRICKANLFSAHNEKINSRTNWASHVTHKLFWNITPTNPGLKEPFLANWTAFPTLHNKKILRADKKRRRKYVLYTKFFAYPKFSPPSPC